MLLRAPVSLLFPFGLRSLESAFGLLSPPVLQRGAERLLGTWRLLRLDFCLIHELLFHGLCGSIANVEVVVTLVGIWFYLVIIFVSIGP